MNAFSLTPSSLLSKNVASLRNPSLSYIWWFYFCLFLLEQFKYTGRKTRCYKIKKEDVIAYLEDRKVFPEAYAAPRGWYKGYYEIKLGINLPPEVLEDMHEYYADLFSQYKDVLTALEVCKLTGYSKTAINNWCAGGQLKAFKRSNINHIPKIYLVKFFCSPYSRSVTRKSDWHIRTLKRFPSWRSQKQSQGGAK